MHAACAADAAFAAACECPCARPPARAGVGGARGAWPAAPGAPAHEHNGAQPPWRLRPAEEGCSRRGGGDRCSCSVPVDASAPWYASTVSMGARAQDGDSRQGPLTSFPNPDYPARAPQRADRILDQKLRRVKDEIQRNRRVLQQSVKRWSLEAAAGLPLSPVSGSELGHSSSSAGLPPPLDGRFSCEDVTSHPGAGPGLAGCTAVGGARNSKGKRAGEVRGRARSHELALLHSISEQTGLSQAQSALQNDVCCAERQSERRAGSGGGRERKERGGGMTRKLEAGVHTLRGSRHKLIRRS